MFNLQSTGRKKKLHRVKAREKGEESPMDVWGVAWVGLRDDRMLFG
jgi:hypothetical protein